MYHSIVIDASCQSLQEVTFFAIAVIIFKVKWTLNIIEVESSRKRNIKQNTRIFQIVAIQKDGQEFLRF